MKSVYFIIAVLCVVPCAFQDVWDEYDTWYDDFNKPEDDNLADKLENKPMDENVQELIERNDDDREDDMDYGDYNHDIGFKMYQIEDNRDEVEPEFEEGQEFDQEQKLDEKEESAIDDFDTLQKILDNDEQVEDLLDKVLAVDEKSLMDVNDLLPGDVQEDLEENIKLDVEGDQPDVDGIKKETQIILEKSDNVLGEDNGDMGHDIDENGIEADMKRIIEETQQILEETDKEFDENKKDEQKEVLEDSEQDGSELVEKEISIDDTQNIENKLDEDLPKGNIAANVPSIIEETQKILDETNSDFVENKENQDNLDEANLDIINEGPINENANEEAVQTNGDDDTVDKVYEDLNADLDKLLKTWKQLSPESDDNDFENIESDENKDKQPMLEEPNADDDNGRESSEIGDEAKENNDFDYEGESRILAMRNDYYDSILDKDLADLFKEFEDDYDNVENEKKDDLGPILYVNDALDAHSVENNEKDNIEFKSADLEESEEVVVKDNNLDDVPNESVKNEQKVSANKIDDQSTPKTEAQNASGEEKVTAKSTIDVDQLNSSELDELSKQFVMLHDSEMQSQRDDTPIHITLTADEPVVITSPNYPSAYPTDTTTIDWILEGLGTGIEVNITDLAINSAMGHYLMLKPGQTDASGDQGIVFAYRINSERRYRFRDVNRMFVRFNPLGGMSFSRGFQLSARMIDPLVDDEDDQSDLPEQEFLVPEPLQTTTLILAGINATGFHEISEEFRRLLADMATMYINANEIDPGMNATTVVTQITRIYVCNVNWPGFDSCLQVTFGVPLVYEDENTETRLTENELMEMWYTYATRDPFATRLAMMGISDYSVPKDSSIMTVWVVISVGVLISAAMLAFALWRYSCVDNYTRMQELGDTDSIQDKKRGLDMYPTPHQTLPPLYTENEYKWADRTFDDSTRVDMGGYTNNTFTQDDLSDDSEDDITAKRDRKVFKPRDFNVV